MGFSIADGTGGGYQARVDEANRVRTYGPSQTVTLYQALKNQAYMCFGEQVPVIGSTSVLSIKNLDANLSILISEISLAAKGVNDNKDNFFTLRIGENMDQTGGTDVDVKNTNMRSASSAPNTTLKTGSTVTLKDPVIFRKIPQGNLAINANIIPNSLILDVNAGLDIIFNSDAATGIALANLTFIFFDPKVDL